MLTFFSVLRTLQFYIDRLNKLLTESIIVSIIFLPRLMKILDIKNVQTILSYISNDKKINVYQIFRSVMF